MPRAISTAVRRKPAQSAHPVWHVYILRCADGTLYTGVAIDILRRVEQHNGKLAGGARYTRTRRPVKLVYRETAANRSAACKREYAIKQLSRRDKLMLTRKSGKPKRVYRTCSEPDK